MIVNRLRAPDYDLAAHKWPAPGELWASYYSYVADTGQILVLRTHGTAVFFVCPDSTKINCICRVDLPGPKAFFWLSGFCCYAATSGLRRCSRACGSTTQDAHCNRQKDGSCGRTMRNAVSPVLIVCPLCTPRSDELSSAKPCRRC